MSFEPTLKNMNVLWDLEVLQLPVPAVRAMIKERRLALSACPDFRDENKTAAGGAQRTQRFIWYKTVLKDKKDQDH